MGISFSHKEKIGVMILLSLLISGCYGAVPRCDIMELCHYSNFYDGVSMQIRKDNFDQLSPKNQVEVFIYGVKYRHHMPFGIIDRMKAKDPSVLPILIDIVEKYGDPRVRDISVKICEAIIVSYPEVKKDKRVSQFVIESKEIVRQEKSKTDEIIRQYQW